MDWLTSLGRSQWPFFSLVVVVGIIPNMAYGILIILGVLGAMLLDVVILAGPSGLVKLFTFKFLESCMPSVPNLIADIFDCRVSTLAITTTVLVLLAASVTKVCFFGLLVCFTVLQTHFESNIDIHHKRGWREPMTWNKKA